MAITLKTELDIFLRQPVTSYHEDGDYTPFGVVHIFAFKLKNIHPDDEVIVIPKFICKEDIKYFKGHVTREEDLINIFVSIQEISVTTKFDIYIKKTSEESIRLFKEGEANKNADIDKLD